MLKKIVIIGPESTGKTTLSEQLATHYNTKWVPEYAREYLLLNGTDYSYENLQTIAEGQIKGEESITNQLSANPLPTYHSLLTLPHSLLFIDTDLYVMKVWSEFVFNRCDNGILTQIAKREYDLYLLCNTDLPWIKDELREYPDLLSRQKLYHYYKDAMVNQHIPWADISGNYELRLQKAIAAVDRMLNPVS